jgi:hypothetical protein
MINPLVLQARCKSANDRPLQTLRNVRISLSRGDWIRTSDPLSPSKTRPLRDGDRATRQHRAVSQDVARFPQVYEVTDNPPLGSDFPALRQAGCNPEPIPGVGVCLRCGRYPRDAWQAWEWCSWDGLCYLCWLAIPGPDRPGWAETPTPQLTGTYQSHFVNGSDRCMVCGGRFPAGESTTGPCPGRWIR